MKSINKLWTMRVIAIWLSENQLVFTAKCIDGSEIDPEVKEKDKLYIIKADKDSNAIPLSKGQLWKVAGSYDGKPEELKFNSGKIRKRYTIRATSLRCLKPDTMQEFVRYVAASPEFKGIGESKAEEIWEQLGEDVFRYAYEGNESKFDFLTPQAAKVFIKACKKYSTLEHAEWLRKYGFKTSVINKIITFHGADSIKAIKTNPYIAVSLGMSFREIDALAQNPNTFNISASDDERRLIAALEYVVHKELEKGHTVSSEKALYKPIRSILGNQGLALQALSLATKATQVRKSDFGIHAYAPLIMEHFIAVELLHLKSLKTAWTSDLDKAFEDAKRTLPFKLTLKQKEAVKTGMSNGVFVLTGGAGTGKTTVLKTLFKALNKIGYNVYPMALAGRAAECIRETTGYLSRTIHSAIFRGDMKSGGKLAVVIDEASMVDIPLLFRLLRRMPENTRFIFVGDPSQLPPVGYGLTLHDFIKADCLPTVELDVVKRSSEESGIPEYTKLIKHGVTPDNLTTGNITFHNTPIKEFSEKAVELLMEANGNAMVVAGSNTKVSLINRAAQFAINPNGTPIFDPEDGDVVDTYKGILREGDPVVFNKNFWEEGVQNGSMGFLEEVCRADDTYGSVVLLDGSTVTITDVLLKYLAASYCITVHKAQGSQFDRIIVVVDTSRVIDRSWIYTALTRAKIKVDIISTDEVFKEAVKAPPFFKKRRTFLWHLLKNPDFKTAA
ncbi:DNA helicase/exodeoxyribonuclease V alpha subunit [Vibrio crassostreae]|uniref:AAA family ATPase n=1 Tax=Vibrio crassostreae TaxID=246167 RepID=UPI000F975037|nr:AAA family ATPase [Vibrio crassostreae]ROR69463.1 DNA helicase/exodeoxyribonuclease V alpha subunit [Vibrio crassostreae]